ncbi:MAG: signal recognition particle-docking protein FtsY [Clostridiales bacterium]|jgi:fused signal recognition particle receptor|nr:signal recognition particle-docking protein FtsY [Clostridiales bacterium]
MWKKIFGKKHNEEVAGVEAGDIKVEPVAETVEAVQVVEAVEDARDIEVAGAAATVEKPSNVTEKKSIFAKALQKTKGVFGNIFVRVDEELYDDLEEMLVVSDVGMMATDRIVSQLKMRVKAKGISETNDVKNELVDVITEVLGEPPSDEFDKKIILVVGVNGVGKTTTIGKLAQMYKNQGKSVMLAAGDTFRAAATEQLTIWANKVDVPIVKQGEGADSSAVIFDAIGSTKAKGTDVLICDTAGRLHNKKNLMDELEKIARVINREYSEATLEVLLVLDATVGQNALIQAKAFAEVTRVDSIVLTKLDGTAKGGIVIAIKAEQDIPVKYVGIGEKIDDIMIFDPRAFAEGLIM